MGYELCVIAGRSFGVLNKELQHKSATPMKLNNDQSPGTKK